MGIRRLIRRRTGHSLGCQGQGCSSRGQGWSWWLALCSQSRWRAMMAGEMYSIRGGGGAPFRVGMGGCRLRFPASIRNRLRGGGVYSGDPGLGPFRLRFRPRGRDLDWREGGVDGWGARVLGAVGRQPSPLGAEGPARWGPVVAADLRMGMAWLLGKVLVSVSFVLPGLAPFGGRGVRARAGGPAVVPLAVPGGCRFCRGGISPR